MTTSVVTFRNEFTEGLLDFVWRQWCRIGVAGSVRQKGSWVIDPELLLAFTTEVARHDARMFDECMEWLIVNGRWVNAQRLSAVMRRHNVGDMAVAGAIASCMSEQDKSMKWRGMAERTISLARAPAEPLFRAAKANTASPAGNEDANFIRYGLIREPLRIRGLGQPVNLKDPVNLMIRSRAVFGIGLRADVMAYLMTADGAHPREMARTLGYNHMRVQEMLVALADAGIAFVRPAGRAKQYWIDRAKWWNVLMGDRTTPPQWLNWIPLIRGLTCLWREIWAMDEVRADDYIFSSKMRTAMQSARGDLLNSRMGFVIEDDKGHVAEAYLPIFIRDTANILKCLSA